MPDLLHPALVHLPLGLALAMPLFLLVLVVLDAKGKLTRQAWVLAMVLQLLITVGAFSAMKTGEAEEEHVERGIPEAALHEHEEAAEVFTWASVALLALSILPVLNLGAGLRRVVPFALLGISLVVLALALRVGKLGGALVYQHQAPAIRAGMALPGLGLGLPADSTASTGSAKEGEDDDD